VRLATVLPALQLTVNVTAAAPAMRGVVDGPHPDAPPELQQYAFIVGDWDCTTRFMKPDGSGFVEGKARWSGYWILGGTAIQDVWAGKRNKASFRVSAKYPHGSESDNFNLMSTYGPPRGFPAGSRPRRRNLIA
jgi:hypothetical protein